MLVSRRTFSGAAKDVLDPARPSGATERAPDLLLRENGVECALDRLSVGLGPKQTPRPLDLTLEAPVPRGHTPGYRPPRARGKTWGRTSSRQQGKKGAGAPAGSRGSAPGSGRDDPQVDACDADDEQDDHEQHRREHDGKARAVSQQTSELQKRDRHSKGRQIEHDLAQLARRLSVTKVVLDQSYRKSEQREGHADRPTQPDWPPLERSEASFERTRIASHDYRPNDRLSSRTSSSSSRLRRSSRRRYTKSPIHTAAYAANRYGRFVRPPPLPAPAPRAGAPPPPRRGARCACGARSATRPGARAPAPTPPAPHASTDRPAPSRPRCA